MKTVEEIYEEMVSIFNDQTGYNVNTESDISVRLYAVASQIYGLYAESEWLSKQCFPQTATESFLEQHAYLRGIERREATYAQGYVDFYGEESTTERSIPVGTVCMTGSGVRFVTQEIGVLTEGETSVSILVEAVEPGVSGNVVSGSVTTMAVAPIGITHCLNGSGFTGGMEQEEDDTLRERVLETYARLPNGANVAFYEQCAMSFDDVVATSVIPRSRGIGTVDVVIATASGIPDESLLEEVRVYLQERREIAVDVEVLAPVEKSVDISIALTVESGKDKEFAVQQVTEVIQNYCNGTLLSCGLLRVKLGDLVYSVDGVENYSILQPSADIAAEDGVLIKLAQLDVQVQS